MIFPVMMQTNYHKLDLYAGKFNIILLGVLVELKKSFFLLDKILYPGTSYSRSLSPHKTNWIHHFDGMQRIGFLKLLILLNIFLSKTVRACSSFFVIVHVSAPLDTTGLISLI
jgi:hypothetical protein